MLLTSEPPVGEERGAMRAAVSIRDLHNGRTNNCLKRKDQIVADKPGLALFEGHGEILMACGYPIWKQPQPQS